MQPYTNSAKYCATCAYWLGNRDPDRSGLRLTVTSAMEKGKCGNQKCGCRNQQKQANSNCSAWSKWPVLK